MITFLGTILFATILCIGALDGRSGLSIFGKYSSALSGSGRPRPGFRRRAADDDQSGSD